MLLVLAMLVLGSDVLERWGTDSESQRERVRASAQLTAIGLVLVFVVALVQSRYLFTVGDPLPEDTLLNRLLNLITNLGRNLQAAGPGGEPVLGAFTTDHLTMISRLTFVGAALLTTLLTASMQPKAGPGEFYSLILFATAGMCLMAGASEFILAYIALELSSISLYILAGYFRSDNRSVEAGLKYFLFGALSSGILLYGMSLAYGFTASANSGSGTAVIGTLFSEVGRAAQANAGSTTLLTLAMVFIVGGLGYKVAVVPFHSWSPDVYQGAPTPVTAFIATASKMAGFILLYRMLGTIFPSLAGTPSLQLSANGWTSLLAVIALLTLIVGNLSALPQTNAKRLLAYSSIGHAGFLLLAVILWQTTLPGDQAFGTASLLYYLIVYTLTNLGAFGVLTVVADAVGGDELNDLNGLWRRNLSLAVLLTVLVLSLAGIPPLAGYWAKFFVFMAGYRAGALWLVTVAVVMTIVSLFYYLRFLKAMWMRPPASPAPIATPRTVNAALIAATLLVVVLGLFPGLIWDTLGRAALVAAR